MKGLLKEAWLPLLLGVMVGAGLVLGWWLVSDALSLFEPVEAQEQGEVLSQVYLSCVLLR